MFKLYKIIRLNKHPSSPLNIFCIKQVKSITLHIFEIFTFGSKLNKCSKCILFHKLSQTIAVSEPKMSSAFTN